MSDLQPGSIVTPSLGVWYTYELFASDDEVVVYVGQTTSPRDRLRCHRRDPSRAIRAWVRSVSARGACVQMRITGVYGSERDARKAELDSIARIPGLLNIAKSW